MMSNPEVFSFSMLWAETECKNKVKQNSTLVNNEKTVSTLTIHCRFNIVFWDQKCPGFHDFLFLGLKQYIQELSLLQWHLVMGFGRYV